MPELKRIQFTPALVSALERIHAELARLAGIRSGIFPSTGPIVIRLTSSEITRSLARKVGIPVAVKNIVFVINAEKDLPRVFMDVRNFAREVNSVAKLLPPALSAVMDTWAASAPAGRPRAAPDLSDDPDLGVFERHVSLTPIFLTALKLLNDVFSKWAPARFGIFAPAGPLTVVMRMTTPARVAAHSLGIPSWGACEMLIVTGVNSALAAVSRLQELNAAVADMVTAVPPALSQLIGVKNNGKK